MKDRIRKLRKHLDLTQREFADKIGVRQNTVAQYEIGRNEPVDSVFSLICREFNVNEEWLRTGIGEMFIEKDDEDVLMEQLGRILGSDSSFKKRFVKAFMSMTDEEWELVERKMREIVGDDSEN